jgi:hypothetical protein
MEDYQSLRKTLDEATASKIEESISRGAGLVELTRQYGAPAVEAFMSDPDRVELVDPTPPQNPDEGA